MKNYIIPLIVIVSVITAVHLFTSSFYKKQVEREQVKLSNEIGKIRYSEWSFSLLKSVLGKSVDETKWSHFSDTVSADDCISYPCLLIYVPPMENLCMSCVNYAISSVQKVYNNEWESPKIGILTCGYNGELKERILKKKVYSIEKDVYLINNFNNPVYLVVDKNKRIISSFMPYEVMEGWAEDYLNSIRTLLK